MRKKTFALVLLTLLILLSISIGLLSMSICNDGLFINDFEVLDKEHSETWFDAEKTKLPTLKQCRKISVGMSIDEVVRIIGKPQRSVGSGFMWYQFDVADGSKLNILFGLDIEKEDEYVLNNPDVLVYGSHFLYVEEIKFVNE